MLNKWKAAAQKAGQQAQAFGIEVQREAASGGAQALASFTLPKECEKAAKILNSCVRSLFASRSRTHACCVDVAQ